MTEDQAPSMSDGYHAVSKSAGLSLAKAQEKLDAYQRIFTIVAIVVPLLISGAIYIVISQSGSYPSPMGSSGALAHRLEQLEESMHQLEARTVRQVDILESLTTKIKSSEFALDNDRFPIGTIIPVLSAENPPRGWIFCDGRRITKAEYSELYASLSSAGIAEDIRVPDLTDALLTNGPPKFAKISWYIKAK